MWTLLPVGYDIHKPRCGTPRSFYATATSMEDFETTILGSTVDTYALAAQERENWLLTAVMPSQLVLCQPSKSGACALTGSISGTPRSNAQFRTPPKWKVTLRLLQRRRGLQQLHRSKEVQFVWVWDQINHA